jgi:Uri superfamily endonuclease
LKGIYVLTIQVSKTIDAEIGAVGKLTFSPGTYVYVGSAQNNLELRVARHKRKEKRLFWHVDYLLNNEAAEVTEVYFVAGQKPRECQIATLIQQNGGEPIAGFGCSDCHCNSHLFRVESPRFLEKYMQPMGSS